MKTVNKQNVYHISAESFKKIPGCPVAYWASDTIVDIFSTAQFVENLAEVKIGMGTGKNEVFVRQWWEVAHPLINFTLQSIEELDNCTERYFPYNKGGDFRLWYGNLQEVLWFDVLGRQIMNSMAGHRENGGYNYYFREGITWSFISSSKFGVRHRPSGSLFDVAGSTLFVLNTSNHLYLLGFLSSVVCDYILGLLNPTLNYQAGNIKNLPIIFNCQSQVDTLVTSNIALSQTDWDSFETSWDFERHPLARGGFSRVSEAFGAWERECEERFARLKANEEELNRIFIDIYGLQDELTPEVEEKDVTVRRADLARDIRSLVSYAVGCMFGRYSLDTPGLAYAGGDWDPGRYVTFPADKDGILPICDDEYFHDDIVNLFAEFVKTVYGESTLEENLRFIADALGSKGSSPREMIRNYFLNSFYADHLKIYQKRPIYWLFDSGKKNGFKCLVYLHRYRPDTIARVRTDYVHEQQSRYRTAIADLEQRVNNASTSERLKLSKQLAVLQAQADELQTYEEKIHHLADQMIPLDLDDGVKVNYAKLGEVVRGI